MNAQSNENKPMVERPGPVIGIDARTFDYSDSISRGIGHYALHHLLAVGRICPGWQFVLLNDDGKPNSATERLMESSNFTLQAIDSCGAAFDLFHIPDPMNLSTGFDSPMRLFPSTPATVTFHDLTPLRYYWRTWPDVSKRAYQSRLDQLCKRPAHLLANSEFTKRDLIDETQIAEERVTAVFAGLNRGTALNDDLSLSPAVRSKYNIRRPFFLHVGALDPHKNFESVVQSFGKLPRGSAQLVVVGQMDGFLKQIADFCAKSKMKDIIFTGFIPRSDLEVLYREAIALLFLSHYEGFGFPLLEAMAHRCPVIAANATSLPEIAGDAVMLFAPSDIAGVSQGMQSLARSLTKREALRQKGLAQAGKFTWEITAKKTVAVWEQMLDPQQTAAPLPFAEPSGKSVSQKPIVPSASASAPLQSPIVWMAPWQNPSGYCSEALSYARGLEGHCSLELVDVARARSEQFVAGLPDAMRSLLRSKLRNMPGVAGKVVIQHFPASGFAPLPGAKYCIGRTMFETDSLPADWVARCNQLDEIWVPSQFNFETFAAAGVKREKIFVIPQAADETLFNPDTCTPLELPGRAKFNFLSIFEWSSRKAWDILLASYLREFSASDDVCLYLRTYLVNQPDRDPKAVLEPIIREFAATLNLGGKPLPRIEFITEQIATREFPRLYKAVDCLVAPSHGEGWGRPQHEAMMMGLPVIATRWSGNTEFMSEENSFLIDYELARVENVDSGFEHYRGHRWANASARHLRELMRQVQQNRETARVKGAKAREQMLARYSLAPVAQIVLGRLAEIESGRATCRPAVKTGAHTINVDWVGSFLDAGSLSHVNRAITQALAGSSQIKLNRVNSGAETSPSFKNFASELAKAPSTDAAVTVRHAWPPNWIRPKSGKLVVVQPWEFGSLPVQWVKDLAQVDEIWVPSQYVRNVYVDSGVPANKVFVVPNGVDTATFNPQAAPMKLPTTKKFKFLFVGGTILRKGPDVLLKAYLDAFTAADDVCLVIKDFGGKTVYAGQTFEEKIRAAQSQPNAPQILYLNDELTPEEVPALYRACDCLVLPYRGEGYGLPAVEAMACGLPVMVTAGGATDDFVRDDFAFRIPAQRQMFGNEISGLKLVKPGWLLEPNADVLAQHMKWLAVHPEETRERGHRASEHAKKFCSWEAAAKIALERIVALNTTRTEVRAPEAKPAKRVAITLPPSALLGNLGEARELLRQKKSRLA
jgi:glycosyltransferase involved in cell wall biosynthesis